MPTVIGDIPSKSTQSSARDKNPQVMPIHFKISICDLKLRKDESHLSSKGISEKYANKASSIGL
jgi:hypothetical protein